MCYVITNICRCVIPYYHDKKEKEIKENLEMPDDNAVQDLDLILWKSNLICWYVNKFSFCKAFKG